MEANAVAGVAAITLPSGIYTISLDPTFEDAPETGDLDITGDLIVKGAGADTTIVDGGGLARVFDIVPGITVEMSGLTVRNGEPIFSLFTRGRDLSGGGIRNAGTLTLTNVTVSGNTAVVLGGGIATSGTLTMTNVTVSDNTVPGTEGIGRISGDGGGIANSGTLVIVNSTITRNTTRVDGGGILSGGGTLTMTNVTVSGNSARVGGGIRSRSPVAMINVTVSGNTGGGIFFGRVTATVTDSTVSENTGVGMSLQEGTTANLTNVTVNGNTGRGIRSSGTLTMSAVTVSDNTAAVDGGGINNEGELTMTDGTVSRNSSSRVGGGIDNGNKMDLTNSAVSDNSAGAYGGGVFNPGLLTMTNVTVGSNSASIGGGVFTFGTLTLTDSTGSGNTAGKRGGGIYNFGELDTTNSDISGDPPSLLTPPAGSTFIVDSTVDAVDTILGDRVCADSAGNCTLRAAIMEANAAAGAFTITLPSGIYTFRGTVLAKSGTLTKIKISDEEVFIVCAGGGICETGTRGVEITGDLIINGAGAGTTIVDGNALLRVFDIVSGITVDISGLTVRNGDSKDGSGVRNDGTLTMTNVTVSNNTAAGSGGGIHNNGTLTITDVTVSNNTARGTGGGIHNNGTLTITGVTVSDNTAAASGGGIYNGLRGTLTLTYSTGSGNRAGTAGGGIHNRGELDSTNSSITGDPP